MESVSAQLSLWKGRHLSMGDIVALINSVLNRTPLYFFIFL